LDILMNNAYSDLIMKEYADDEENFTIFLKWKCLYIIKFII
jgi:hypothetical protein